MILKILSILFAFSFCNAVAQKCSDYKVYDDLKKAQKNSDKVFALNLEGQGLMTIPGNILELKRLIELDLSNNSFIAFPLIILDIENLKVLKLNRCNLNYIPEDIDKLKRLEELWLMSNKIEEIPKSIRNMKHLKLIVLIDNLISTSNIEALQEEVGDSCIIIDNLEFFNTK